MMFHCGFSDRRVDGLVLRASVFLTILFLLYVTVDVLSPNVICSLDGVNLPGTRVWLSSGAFSESEESGVMARGTEVCGCSSSLYWISSSGSESSSKSHIASLGSAGCFSFFLTEIKNRILLNVSLVLFGLIIIFESSVFGGRPKYASNGLIFVTEFGMSLIDWIIFVTIWARWALDHSGSDCMIAIQRLIVWIRRSIISVALWSPAGASISLLFLSSQYSSNSRVLKAWAWSHLIERGIPPRESYNIHWGIYVLFLYHSFYTPLRGDSVLGSQLLLIYSSRPYVHGMLGDQRNPLEFLR